MVTIPTDGAWRLCVIKALYSAVHSWLDDLKLQTSAAFRFSDSLWKADGDAMDERESVSVQGCVNFEIVIVPKNQVFEFSNIQFHLSPSFPHLHLWGISSLKSFSRQLPTEQAWIDRVNSVSSPTSLLIVFHFNLHFTF